MYCVCIFISRHTSLQWCLILDYLLILITVNIFSIAYILNQLNADNKISLSVKPNQHRQLTVLTMSENVLRLCAVRFTLLLLQNVHIEIEMVCMSIKYSLLKFATPHKTTKNKDPSHN